MAERARTQPSCILYLPTLHIFLSSWASIPPLYVITEHQAELSVLCLFVFYGFGISWAGNSEKAMATHSSTPAWKNPWTEEPGRLQSRGSRRVGHNWVASLSLFTFMHWRRKWQPTPVFLPGESQGWGAWWAAVYGVAQSRTWLKQLSSSSSRAGNWLEYLG